MHVKQVEGLHMGQSSGVLQEVSAFQKFPLIEVSLYTQLIILGRKLQKRLHLFLLKSDRNHLQVYPDVCGIS